MDSVSRPVVEDLGFVAGIELEDPPCPGNFRYPGSFFRVRAFQNVLRLSTIRAGTSFHGTHDSLLSHRVLSHGRDSTPDPDGVPHHWTHVDSFSDGRTPESEEWKSSAPARLVGTEVNS